MKADEPHGNAWQYIEWGKAFRPFIENFSAPAMATIGEGFLVVGDLGDQQLHEPILIGPGGFTIKPTIASWSGTTATFTIPVKNFPSGTYRFALIRRSGPTDTSPLEISSNSFEVTLRSVFDEWRHNHFSGEQLDDAATCPDGDPDKDGLPNFVEWVLDSDPMAHGESKISWFKHPTGNCMVASFRVLNAATDVLIRLQASPDLQTWSYRYTVNILPSLFGPCTTLVEMPLFDLGPSGEVESPFFFRFKFIRPEY